MGWLAYDFSMPGFWSLQHLKEGPAAMPSFRGFFATLPLLVGAGIGLGAVSGASAQAWKDAPAYDKKYAANVLDRSVFFLPLFGSVYRAKFEVMIKEVPGLRGIVIHNHGCGGQWGWETHVSQFFYREGFAVVTPEFVSR